MVRGEKDPNAEPKEEIFFNCAICDIHWPTKIKRAGPRLCSTCVELRRAVNSFINKGLLDPQELETRLAKIIAELKKA